MHVAFFSYISSFLLLFSSNLPSLSNPLIKNPLRLFSSGGFIGSVVLFAMFVTTTFLEISD